MRKSSQVIMYKIAVTGGMGSGKSVVSRFLHDSLGGIYLNADLICRNLLEPGEAGWTGLKKILPKELFVGDRLNRPLFRKMLFDDHQLRNTVDGMLHPLVRDSINTRLHGGEGDDPGAFAVVEVPLLYEAGWQGDFDRVVVVNADRQNCINRIVARDEVSIAEATASFDTQYPLEQKVKLADYTVQNNSSQEETIGQLQELVQILREKVVGAAK